MQATVRITGTITDSDGAVVTGANIALESQLTHEQNTSKSDGTGFFNFTALSPGVFHVTITAKGSRNGQQLTSFSNGVKTTSWPTSR